MAQGVARTFQNIRLFGTMTAVENVLVGQHSRMKAGLFGSILRTPWQRKEERDVEKAREELNYVGLKERRSTRSRSTSPTATSAGSRSRARSRPTRSCCCSTSRPPA